MQSSRAGRLCTVAGGKMKDLKNMTDTFDMVREMKATNHHLHRIASALEAIVKADEVARNIKAKPLKK